MFALGSGAVKAPQNDIAQVVDVILSEYEISPESTIMALQDVQAKYNWIPPEALARISERLDVPLAQLYHIGTFYKAFSLEPRGKHILHLCMGTACHVRGAALIAGELSRQWCIELGKTTPDKLFTLEKVNCLGACAIGPIIVVDGDYRGNMTINRANALIKRIMREEKGGSEDA